MSEHNPGFRVRVLTPLGVAHDGRAESLQVRAIDGDLTVLEGHAPLVAPLGPGVLRIRSGSGESRLVIGGGILRVTPEDAVVLADSAERPEQIDVERALAARERAMKRLHTSGAGQVRAQAALERALVRIRAAGTSHRLRRPDGGR